jgi:uncharacterized membrane protein
MNLTRPKYSSAILILMGLLAFIFPVIAVCYSLCPTDNPGVIFFQHANCGITTHSFVFFGIGLSVLFSLSLIGIFIVNKMLYIPAGYPFPMFKPPRISS